MSECLWLPCRAWQDDVIIARADSGRRGAVFWETFREFDDEKYGETRSTTGRSYIYLGAPAESGRLRVAAGWLYPLESSEVGPDIGRTNQSLSPCRAKMTTIAPREWAGSILFGVNESDSAGGLGDLGKTGRARRGAGRESITDQTLRDPEEEGGARRRGAGGVGRRRTKQKGSRRGEHLSAGGCHLPSQSTWYSYVADRAAYRPRTLSTKARANLAISQGSWPRGFQPLRLNFREL